MARREEPLSWPCGKAGGQDAREVASVAMSGAASAEEGQGRTLSAVTNEMVSIAMDEWRGRDLSREERPGSDDCRPVASGEVVSSRSGSSDSAEAARSPTRGTKRKATEEAWNRAVFQAKSRRETL